MIPTQFNAVISYIAGSACNYGPDEMDVLIDDAFLFGEKFEAERNKRYPDNLPPPGIDTQPQRGGGDK